MGRRRTFPRPAIAHAERNNTTVLFGEKLALKLFRRVETGPHPEVEIGRFLTRKRFRHAPPLAGALERVRGRGEPLFIATLHGFVRHQKDGWDYTLGHLGEFFERALASHDRRRPTLPCGDPLNLAERTVPHQAQEQIGSYLISARLLGQRTAELHCALVDAEDDPRFAPEPFTSFYRHSRYQVARGLIAVVLRTLRRESDDLPETARRAAGQVLSSEEHLRALFRPLLERSIRGVRMRCHGNYHLEKLLYTGDDFVIIDFEGESARPLPERRLKRSPLMDVAGMLRSFANAAYAAALDRVAASDETPRSVLEEWARFWHRWVSAAFLQEYLRAVEAASILPPSPEERAILLTTALVERAVYEVGYELNNRPERVEVPLLGLLELLEDEAGDR